MAYQIRGFLIALAVTLASPAQAGGLWLNEFNSWDMGRAGAGAPAGTGDASAVLHNPASMVELDQSELMVGGGYIAPTTEFDLDQGSLVNGTGDGGDAGQATPSLAAFYVRPINDKWTVGASFVGLSGASLDYDGSWAGRFQAQQVDLIVAGLHPGAAYKVNEKLALGLGVAMMYSDLELKIAVPNATDPINGPEGQAKVEGDDFKVAPKAALHYRFNDRTSFGAYYLGKLEFEYSGDASLQPIGLEVGVETEISFAAMLRTGLRHQFNEQWRVHLSWGWDNWSEMDDVILSTSSNGAVLPRNWEDTYHYAAGLEYQVNDRWTVQGGIAYDTDPVDAQDRTADMPIDEQFRYALGARYQRDNGTTISGQFVYADYGDARIDSARQPPLVGYRGKYSDNQILFFALTVSWPMNARR